MEEIPLPPECAGCGRAIGLWEEIVVESVSTPTSWLRLAMTVFRPVRPGTWTAHLPPRAAALRNTQPSVLPPAESAGFHAKRHCPAFQVFGPFSSGLALSPWSWGFPGGKNCDSGRSRSGTYLGPRISHDVPHSTHPTQVPYRVYSISRTHIGFPCAHASAPVCSRPGCSGTAVVPLCLSVTVPGLLEGGKR